MSGINKIPPVTDGLKEFYKNQKSQKDKDKDYWIPELIFLNVFILTIIIISLSELIAYQIAFIEKDNIKPYNILCIDGSKYIEYRKELTQHINPETGVIYGCE